MFVPRYTCQMFVWSLQRRSHDLCTWSLDVGNDSDSSHTQGTCLLGKYQRVVETQEKSLLDKQQTVPIPLTLPTVGARRTSGRYLYIQVRRYHDEAGTYSQARNVCHRCQSWERGFGSIGNVHSAYTCAVPIVPC